MIEQKMKPDNTGKEKETIKIAVLNIPQLSDERWNQRAYKNWIERRCGR